MFRNISILFCSSFYFIASENIIVLKLKQLDKFGCLKVIILSMGKRAWRTEGQLPLRGKKI